MIGHVSLGQSSVVTSFDAHPTASAWTTPRAPGVEPASHSPSDPGRSAPWTARPISPTTTSAPRRPGAHADRRRIGVHSRVRAVGGPSKAPTRRAWRRPRTDLDVRAGTRRPRRGRSPGDARLHAQPGLEVGSEFIDAAASTRIGPGASTRWSAPRTWECGWRKRGPDHQAAPIFPMPVRTRRTASVSSSSATSSVLTWPERV